MRRRTLWSTTLTLNSTVATGTQIAPVNLLTPLLVGGIGVIGGTVLRTHVNLNFSNLDTDTQPAVVWGLVVYDTTKVSATVPSLISEPNLDWAMYELLTPGTSSGNIVRPENAATTGVWGREYDVKSRRRLHEMEDGFFFCLDNNGSQTLTYSLLLRCLIALP
jgi:hypothetical protein